MGGTQRANAPHRLYRFSEGQCSQPLCQPAAGGPQCLVGYTRDGREVNASVEGNQVLGTFMELRKTLAVECTGLGGAELNSPTPWDLLVRTGRHHEEVYGPSLARLEFPGAFNKENVSYVGLGLTKATHEFVMLHYFATDSAQIWDDGGVGTGKMVCLGNL